MHKTARLIAESGSATIGVVLERDAKMEDQMSYQLKHADDSYVAVIQTGWQYSEENEDEIGKQFELAASGFWRDLKEKGLDLPAMSEFNMVVSDVLMEELKAD